MLGTPAYDGRVDVGYTFSLVKSIQACAAYGIALHPVWWPGEALIQHARNMLVGLAVEGGVDDLIFVDSDEEWEPDHILALLSHPVDVVGAAVRKRTDEVEAYNVRSKTANIPVDIKTGLWLVDGIGTGFLRLSRRALTALFQNSEPYDHSGTKCRMVFDVGVVNGRLVGEDICMCDKLTALGFKIHVDPSFTITHVGTKKFKGCIQTYVEKLKASEKVSRIKACG